MIYNKYNKKKYGKDFIKKKKFNLKKSMYKPQGMISLPPSYLAPPLPLTPITGEFKPLFPKLQAPCLWEVSIEL